MKGGCTLLARAPGRVNLMGEHTDYTGGLALPMAIDLEVRARAHFVDAPASTGRLWLVSDQEDAMADIPLAEASLDAGWLASLQPPWARLAAAVVAALRSARPPAAEEAACDVRVAVTSTLRAGAGLSSSAAFEVCLALALGATGGAVDVAIACQQAEQAATGVHCGLLDQLTAIAGVEGAALLVDFATTSFQSVPVPAGLEVIVADSGQRRMLSCSGYEQRRSQLQEAERHVGPLRNATLGDLAQIRDEVVRRRARHVVTDNARILAAAEAMRCSDLAGLGEVLSEGHRSYASDFGASTEAVDHLVERLQATGGVHGARLTGGGFGGCVVALAEPGSFGRCRQAGVFPAGAWLVKPSAGASLVA